MFLRLKIITLYFTDKESRALGGQDFIQVQLHDSLSELEMVPPPFHFQLMHIPFLWKQICSRNLKNYSVFLKAALGFINVLSFPTFQQSSEMVDEVTIFVYCFSTLSSSILNPQTSVQ